MKNFRSQLLEQVKTQLVTEIKYKLESMRETFSIHNLGFYNDCAFEIVGFGSEHGIFETSDFLFWHEEINRTFDERLLELSYRKDTNNVTL